MTNNDTSTLNGALQELGETMAANLEAKGVTASASDGLTTLAGKILTIPSGGSCYHIEFSEDSYVAVGGTATLEIMLQENYAPKSGATVTVTGSDSSLYTGITDSTGVASVTVTGLTATATFTASYSNVSDVCTVTVGPAYLFYDACDSADGLSKYGNSVYVKNTSSTLTLSYDSTMNAYKVVGNNIDGYAKIPIPALDGKDGFYIEAEFYSTYNNTKHQSGICVYDTSASAGNSIWARDIANINRCGWLKTVNGTDSGEAGNSQKFNLPVYNNWYKLRFEINGTTATAKWMKTDDTLIYSYSYTIPSYNSNSIGLQFLAWANPYYVRNIKAEPL